MSAEFSNVVDDDIHGGDDYRVFDDPIDAPPIPRLVNADTDDDFEPCCDHPELDEKTGLPDYHGHCNVYLVCDNCQTQHGIVGQDGIL